MEIVLLIIMALVSVNFVLKLTTHGAVGILVVSALAALFVGLMWPVAIEQSGAEVSAWLADQPLMLDVAVLLTVDVVLQMAFCLLSVGDVRTFSRPVYVCYCILLWLPGILIFPVLFSLLVYAIFILPGIDFATVAWGTAGVVAVVTPLAAYAMKWLFPEMDMRLELMFMLNALIAILGVIATVNGQTSVKPAGSVEWGALAAVVAIIAVGAAIGFAIYNRKYGSKSNNYRLL